jgi:hypothetical protein
MNSTFFFVVVVVPCSSETARRFRRTYRLRLQGRNPFQDWTRLYQAGFPMLYCELAVCLCWFTYRPWIWRRHVPPKRRISEKFTVLQRRRLHSWNKKLWKEMTRNITYFDDFYLYCYCVTQSGDPGFKEWPQTGYPKWDFIVVSPVLPGNALTVPQFMPLSRPSTCFEVDYSEIILSFDSVHSLRDRAGVRA